MCLALDLPRRRTLHSQRGNAAAPQSIAGQLLRGVFPAPGPSVRGGARGGERRGGLVHPFHDVQAQSQLLLPPNMQPIDSNPPVFSSLPVSHADSETAPASCSCLGSPSGAPHYPSTLDRPRPCSAAWHLAGATSSRSPRQASYELLKVLGVSGLSITLTNETLRY